MFLQASGEEEHRHTDMHTYGMSGDVVENVTRSTEDRMLRSTDYGGLLPGSTCHRPAYVSFGSDFRSVKAVRQLFASDDLTR